MASQERDMRQGGGAANRSGRQATPNEGTLQVSAGDDMHPTANPKKYTVGWICALDTEFVAARAFLDEEHDASELVVTDNDNNSYALGMVSRHNVVIAVLPDGQYGTTTAATVARSMMHSFTNVRIGLMVGIGGGAPSSRRDIRLGDVVVNRTAGGLGGVLQYDYGATLQALGFKNTSFLNQSPEVLRASVAALRATYEMKGHQLEKSVEMALGNIKKRSKYKRPPSRATGSTGRMYYTRPNRDEEDDDPVIHYGLIASGNSLVKDANMRDRLADEQDVLCFEMEAAGLMNHFPCLVIRGICDYCDSHKNKDWQGFAAMMAAAYAKDLLSRSRGTRWRQKRRSSTPSVIVIQQELQGVSRAQNTDRIRQWLSPPDPFTNTNHARNLRHEGTGTWILSDSVFQSWQEGSCRHVWLHGLAGCGKIVLSATMLDSLAADDSRRCILSFFFDFNDVAKQTLEGLLRSLAWQLYQRQIGVTVLESTFQAHHKGQQQPTASSLEVMVSSMLQEHGKVSLVLDALDESTSREDLLRWVRFIVNGPEAEFEETLVPLIGSDNCICINKNGVAADIKSYVARRVQVELASRFRWAACQIDSLAQCDSPKTTRAALKKLPKTLAETYQRMLESIPEHKRAVSLRLLKFLVHSKRPLLVSEAIEVIATDIEAASPCFDPDGRLYDTSRLLAYCPGLVSIVSVKQWFPGNSRTELHLAHLSVKEYLLEKDDMTLGAASIPITKTCLVYLKDIRDEAASIKGSFPLSVFSAEFWPDFAALAESNDEVLKLSWDFLQTEHTFVRWAKLYEWGARFDDMGGCEISPLGRASQMGHSRIVQLLLDKGADVNYANFFGNALMAAASRGQTLFVQKLLDLGADVNAQGNYTGNAILAASERGYVDIVRLLLDRGADFTVGNGFHSDALQAAAHGGRLDIVDMLLQKGADVNAGGGVFQNALNAAALRGHHEIVHLLVAKGADMTKSHTQSERAQSQPAQLLCCRLYENADAVTQP
ncbi:hypothetical protein F5X68DRAFT_243307 [Plectosphaerella plurivora]|uniref:Uncharacterized protein n=1 Tax=Plectosphaerella plurivora TaxID=936078 RepID=A0A9P8V7D5_9PEZI|nr:hypothetical protein F5X68DRAFT_243307 [Plectosphaerella plurivora]